MPNLHLSSVSFAEAVVADIPALTDINVASYARETITPFFFLDPNPETYTAFFTARVSQAVHDLQNKVIKITETTTREILGFVCLAFSDGEEHHDGPVNPGGKFAPPPGFNLEFGAEVMRKTKGLKDLVEGKRHFLLSSLSVDPKHQRKGVGSLLVKRCLEIADAEQLPIFLNSFPGARNLYARLGFEDVEHFDIDLNEWGTKWRGYGIYRTYSMVRQPSS